MENDGIRELLAGQGFAEYAAVVASRKRLEYVGSLRVLVDAAAGSQWIYEGRILDCDDEPRPRSKNSINNSPQNGK